MRIEIPIIPTAQERVRVAMKVSKKGKRFIHPYKSKKQQASEEAIKFHLEKYRQNPLLNENIVLHVECYFPRPKNHYGKIKGIEVLKVSAPHYYNKKPDSDNLLKQICDCGNGIIWEDDRFIVESRIEKFYCLTTPKVVLNISQNLYQANAEG